MDFCSFCSSFASFLSRHQFTIGLVGSNLGLQGLGKQFRCINSKNRLTINTPKVGLVLIMLFRLS